MSIIAVAGGWLGRELSPSNWRLQVPPAAASGLDTVLRRLRRAGADARTQRREDLRTPAVADLARVVRARLTGSLGFVVLTGLPVDRYDMTELETVYWILGAHLGRPVSQSRRGDLMGHVEDRGADIRVHEQRGYQSSAELAFPADRTDLIGLLCVRKARSGGVSRLASAAALHDTLLEEEPELLSLLYRPLPTDRRGEEMAGEPPWGLLPVFSNVNGRLVTRYVRRFVVASQRWPDAPRLSREELEAMDRVDEILDRPETALGMELEPGDLQFIDNFKILHARTAFSDDPSVGRRLLLRLWLAHPDSPELPDEFRFLYGSTVAGSYRGGVWPGSWPQDLGTQVTWID